MMKIYYTNKDYNNDIAKMRDIILGFENPHLVSIYRGSLGIGAHLSNILKLPLSIMKFQTYDGQNDKEAMMIFNAGISVDQTLVILDDIYDSGKTIGKVKEYFHHNYPNIKIKSITLHGHKNHDDKNQIYINEKPEGWIVYPWEI